MPEAAPKPKPASEVLAQQVLSPRHQSLIAALTDGPEALLPGEAATVEKVIRGMLALGVTLENLPHGVTTRKPTCPDCGKLVNRGNDCVTCQRLAHPGKAHMQARRDAGLPIPKGHDQTRPGAAPGTLSPGGPGPRTVRGQQPAKGSGGGKKLGAQAPAIPSDWGDEE